MTAVRVLRVYHSAVVDEYRQRERLLRSRHGYDVHLVSPRAWSEGGSVVRAPSQADFPVHIVPARGRQHPILFWYSMPMFRRVLRDVRPAIVDLHEEPYSLAAAAALRALRIEAPAAKVCIYTAQNIRKRYPPPFRQFEARALALADAAYPCSTEAGEVLRAKGYAGPLHVLPLGVSTPPARARPEGAPVVGFVGRVESYKGPQVALRAFARGAPPGSRLAFIGSGPAESALRREARELGVEERVDFLGALSQEATLEHIRQLAVLVAPSLTTKTWKEQFGRVAAQAMIAGVPVVASDSGSLPEVVGDGGIIVPEGNVEALAAELGHLLRDEARWARVARAGRARALERLTWERVADGCHRMYEAVLADGRGST